MAAPEIYLIRAAVMIHAPDSYCTGWIPELDSIGMEMSFMLAAVPWLRGARAGWIFPRLYVQRHSRSEPAWIGRNDATRLAGRWEDLSFPVWQSYVGSLKIRILGRSVLPMQARLR